MDYKDGGATYRWIGGATPFLSSFQTIYFHLECGLWTFGASEHEERMNENKVRGIFETFEIENHLPSLLYCGFGWMIFVKILMESWKHQWWVQRVGFWRGRISKSCPGF